MELKDYLKILRKRFLLIAAIVIIACVLTGIKSFMFTEPVYSASAKPIVNQSVKVNGTKQIDLGNLQNNITLISTYMEIINSSAILDKVVSENPDLKVSPGYINSILSVSQSKGSQVMDLTATDTSYERAAEIVNAVAAVFKKEVPSIMNADNITILQKANLKDNPQPVNSSPVINVLIAFIVSALLSVGLVFLLDYLDDTIKTEEDVKQNLELPILAQVAKISKSEIQSRRSHISDKQVGEGKYVSAK